MVTTKGVGDLAARLALERQRLGLTQARMAALAGISTPTQVAYEHGARTPSALYVSRLAEHGLDVQFVLLGESSNDFVSARFDWARLGEVLVAVEEWCDSHRVRIAGHKRGEVMRLIYEEYRRCTTGLPDVGRILSIVA
jgi:transcriptional regulator with XRE-family HTH domain